MIKVLYITNVPIPEKRHTDAHFQELDLLMNHVDGQLISAHPLSRPSSLVPRFLYGRHNLSKIKQLSKEADLVHVFSPILYDYGYLKHLAKTPIVYSTLTPISSYVDVSVDYYLVYDEQSKNVIRQQRADVSVSPPFVLMKPETLPVPQNDFTILMASSPWEKSQFESKGIHLILETLKNIPELNIIWIWRNLFIDEIKKIIKNSNCADQINLVDNQVNVKEYLKKSHAVVLLSKYPQIVKSWPHSLMEGLICGRPLISSPVIPMSQEILKNRWGAVLNEWNVKSIERAMFEVIENYDELRANVLNIPPDRFSSSSFVKVHLDIYRSLI